MPPRRRRRVVVTSEDDEEDQSNNQINQSDDEIDETQPLSRQLTPNEQDEQSSDDDDDMNSTNHSYSLRHRRDGRLPADSLLDSLRAQRLNQQPRWVPSPEDEQDLYVHEEDNHGDEDQPEPSSPPKPSRKRARPTRAPSKRAPRAREPKSEDEAANSDDDNWLVNDEDESVEEDADDIVSHLALRNKQTRADEEAKSTAPTAVAHMDDFDAFPQWIKYLSTVLVDADFSSWVESRPAVKAEITPVIDVLEERWNMQTNNWVKSANWEFASRQTMFKNLCMLPYCESNPISHDDQFKLSKGELIYDASVCAACSQNHQATYIVKLYGVPYVRDALVHPFDQDKIFPEITNYENYEFQVGDLCHKRLRLFHSMYHFKLHVMLSLRMLLEKFQAKKHDVVANTVIIRSIFQEISNEKLSLSKTDSRFRSKNYDVNIAFTFLRKFFEIYNQLQSMATQYSSKDTRSARIDTSYLNSLYPFEAEAAAESLFELRPPHSNDVETRIAVERSVERKPFVTPVDLTSDAEDHISESPIITSPSSIPILKPITSPLTRSSKSTIGEPEHDPIENVQGEISPMMRHTRPTQPQSIQSPQPGQSVHPGQRPVTPASRIKVAANLVSTMPYAELQQFVQLLGARARQDLLAVLEDYAGVP